MICSDLNSLPYLVPSNQTGTCSQLYTLSLKVLKLLPSAFEEEFFQNLSRYLTHLISLSPADLEFFSVHKKLPSLISMLHSQFHFFLLPLGTYLQSLMFYSKGCSWGRDSKGWVSWGRQQGAFEHLNGFKTKVLGS